MSLDSETLSRFAAIDRARAKSARADAAKAAWDKVLARMQGKPRAPADEATDTTKPAGAWAGVVAKKNAEMGGVATSSTSTWSKAIARANDQRH